MRTNEGTSLWGRGGTRHYVDEDRARRGDEGARRCGDEEGGARHRVDYRGSTSLWV